MRTRALRYGAQDDPRVVAETTINLAHVAFAQGRYEQAAEVERERLGMPQGSPERSQRDRALHAMRARVGEEMLATAGAEGREVGLSEAIALALTAEPAG